MKNRQLKEYPSFQEVSSLLADLISIESVNPGYPGSIQAENNIADFIFQYFEKIGADCYKDKVLPNRSNVICFIKGKDRRGLCLESHMDTVSIKNMSIDPLNPMIKDGMMYGRGSADDKGSLAAMMVAVKEIITKGIKPSTDLYFVGAIDEEFMHRGVDHFLEKDIQLQGAVVGEPTQLKVITACKGVVRFEIETRGQSAHSSQPENGHSAIYDMMEIINGIKYDLIPTYQEKNHSLLGSPTMSVGCIEGGLAANIVPDQCKILIDRRLLPGETWEDVKHEVNGLLTRLKRRHSKMNVKLSLPMTTSLAMDTSINERIVQVSTGSCQKIIKKAIVEGVNYGCDASSFTSMDIPSIVLGPGNILQAHTKNEFISLDEVCRAVEIYKQICIDF